MENIRAIIIDDEERAKTSLKLLLNEYCKNIDVVGLYSNVPEGVLAINKHKPKIVFLDIEMPEYNGFELFNFFREIDFEIIFVTAYNEFALKAFEFSAVDYLLKPVDIDKLKGAVKKASSKINSIETLYKFELLKETFNSQQFNKIALPVSDGLSFINTDEITYLEA
ncbi:MAG TPA: response regulator, partial [Bacteroidia bacterium]|nr:response regulator [Bacteroidia bacterium]